MAHGRLRSAISKRTLSLGALPRTWGSAGETPNGGLGRRRKGTRQRPSFCRRRSRLRYPGPIGACAPSRRVRARRANQHLRSRLARRRHRRKRRCAGTVRAIRRAGRADQGGTPIQIVRSNPPFGVHDHGWTSPDHHRCRTRPSDRGRCTCARGYHRARARAFTRWRRSRTCESPTGCSDAPIVHSGPSTSGSTLRCWSRSWSMHCCSP